MSKTNPKPGSPFVLLNCPKEPKVGPFTGGEFGCSKLKAVVGSGFLGLGLDEPARPWAVRSN